MPGTVSDGPSVALSFANNFWGKDDAGVDPLMQRMHNAKQTCDELKAFYNARSSIEEDYARKLLQLSRKPLGSQESGTLRISLDVLRGEVEHMGKSHGAIGAQMKTELEEPLAAFAGAMKERRKIIQNGVEKLLKVKVQQTQQVNKTRDKYEQECLKIKGYLAQGHMVMGQEERKNKAKLEKTQINLATSNTEYETAVKILEETTGRWNRDWKGAADKFQDLEEERLDFMKSSLWSFANIASTVCVSDDASCEKIRLALENCEVEKDIVAFIKDRGTGQEIPDPPKYINFCRGDVSDTQSEASEDDAYSVAQFQRTINPAYRSSSPQPSTYESHHEPKSPAGDASEAGSTPGREVTVTPRKASERTPPKKVTNRSRQLEHDFQQQSTQTPTNRSRQPVEYKQPSSQAVPDRSGQSQLDYQPNPLSSSVGTDRSRKSQAEYQPPASKKLAERSRQPQLEYQQPPANRTPYESSKPEALATVPHDPYPMDGMTMLCRTAPPSERSSAHSPMRSPSRDDHSDYSNPTSFSSVEPASGNASPVKQNMIQQPPPVQAIQQPPPLQEADKSPRKKSGFFGHSPFRRKSNKNNDGSVMVPPPRNTFNSRSTTSPAQNRASARPQQYIQEPQNMIAADRPSASPEPVDPRASFQLNVGNNVFDVATPDRKGKLIQAPAQLQEDMDPIAQALAELKGASRASTNRVSADNYHGVSTPVPGSTPNARPGGFQMANGATAAGLRGTPPPSYDQPVQRLGAPAPAFTAKAMNQTRQKYEAQTQSMFSPSYVRPGSQAGSQGGYNSGSSRPGTRGNEMPRATSPAPPRSASPLPLQNSPSQYHRSASPNPYAGSPNRAVSPNPYGGSQNRAVSPNPYANNHNRAVSPNPYASQNRAVSPNPYAGNQRTRTQSTQGRVPDQGYAYRRSPNEVGRAVSPAPFRDDRSAGSRPGSSHVGSDLSVQLAPAPDEYGSQGRIGGRQMSYYGSGQQGQQVASRTRSKSVADVRQFNREGRPILNFARAMYVYQAVIPEEMSFAKGDVLAILRIQDDGWWEAEIAGKNGRPGLVPSNYLQTI